MVGISTSFLPFFICSCLPYIWLNFEFSVDYPFHSLFFPLYMLITGCVFEFESYKSDILRKLLVTYVPQMLSPRISRYHICLGSLGFTAVNSPIFISHLSCISSFLWMNICVITRFSLKK